MNPLLLHANEYLKQGLRPVQVHKDSKSPIPQGWPKLYPDPPMVQRWFGNGSSCNLGVICGPQPCDINLLAIDTDPKDGGDKTWAALLSTHPPLPPHPVHTTPSGGEHHFFKTTPEWCVTTRWTLGTGIDTRGDGGQVVVPPSRFVDTETGELMAYTSSRETSLLTVSIPLLPVWIGEMLVIPQITAATRRHPSAEHTDNAFFDDFTAAWDWEPETAADGWTVSHQTGDDLYLVRPGKDPRHGHGAMIHLDKDFMVVWSSNAPSALAQPLRQRQVNRDGSLSWRPWDYFVAMRHDRDQASAFRASRRDTGRALGGPARSPGSAPPYGHVSDAVAETVPPARLPMLPPEFWNHPFNAHVLAAARARRCGPDALMLNVLLRASILIPPQFLLPPLAGGASPLNLLGCVVGRTGEGKSVSIAAAGDVLSAEHPWLLWDMPLGTGEGVGDVFMVDEFEDDPKTKRKKRTGRRVQNKDLNAVHFTVDEGAALVETSSRKGVTIIPALCKAWTGVTLGETNADVATRRRVRALSYRVSAVVNIQPMNFHRLFNALNTGTGLTGRFLFAPAADYEMPDERGAWPGELPFPTLHGANFSGELAYHPDIYAEVDAAIVAANRTGGTPENTSHANLLRARVAAIYTLAEDRRTISPSDWDTAGMLTTTSSELLSALDRQAAQVDRDQRYKRATTQAEVELVVESVKDRQAIARMAEAIRRKVADGSWSRNKLSKAVSSTGTRHRFDAALDLAMANGWVSVVDGHVEEA